MILYCRACNENHRLTEGQVERIVYVLQAEVADGKLEDRESWASSYDPMDPDEMDCLEITLAGSHDIEVYGEHAENQVENRRLTHRDQEPV